MPPKANTKTNAEPSMEVEEASPSPPSTTATTLHNRHATPTTEPGTNDNNNNNSSSSSPSAPTPDAPAARTKSVAFSLTSVPLCFLITALSFGALLTLLLAVQIAVLDGMDLSRTAARLSEAGRGEEPLPVWLGNLVVQSLTASRVEMEGGSSGSDRSPHRTPAGPPPLIRSPPPTTQPSTGKTSAAGGGETTTESPAEGSAKGASSALRCYTLEAYSETFLQKPRKAATTKHLFSCGTRVSDLRSTDDLAVLAACAADTIYPVGAYGEVRSSSSHFPSLRVLLTPSEEALHRAIQPVNAVTQRVPLSRLNDDYCDCMDGTDELLTNACSMSGPLFPLAGSRWKSYLVSHQPIQLYDTPDTLQLADAEARGLPLFSRKRGDVGDRLYVSQGPVLPFVCRCGAVRQLLAPSLVGDGVVDCCDGEDEAVLQGSPFVPPPLFTNNPAAVQVAHDATIAAAHAAMQHAWQQRQAEVATLLTGSVVSYTDALFPHYTSATALLVDKGYYALFSSAVVQAARTAAATALRDLYARGHLTHRRRVQSGWEKLGQGLTTNRTRLQMQLANITQELESIERFVQERMSDTRASHPLEAGIPMEMLQRHDQLAHAHQGTQMELQHLVLTSLHHAYGDHYEYYPLVRKALSMASSKVTDANTPPDLYSALAQDRARRVVSPSGFYRLAAEAQQRGEPVPPLHVDNISASHVGIEIMRHAMAAQNFDASEAAFVAQRLGLVPRDSTAPFNPHVFDGITDPFLRAPVLPIGSWQPYKTMRDGRALQLADPAGDLHLARRACVTPTSPLYRGGGRLQTPTRHPEAPRTVSIGDEADEKKSLKEKLKAVEEGKQPAGKKVDIPYHFHMPSVFAVDTYVGTVRCDPDPLPASALARYSADDDDDSRKEGRQRRAGVLEMHVTVLCDTRDRLLHWGRNGKCTQEVIVGTPSACTAWALKAARNSLRDVTPQNATTH